MRNIKIITRLLVLLMAIYGLSYLQPTASATKRTASAVDDPCDCNYYESIEESNAETDLDNCTDGMSQQYDNCMTNAEMVYEEQFWGCWEWHDYDDEYGDWCERQAEQTYDDFASSCSDIYFNNLLPWCYQEYGDQLAAAANEYHSCYCNCPFIDEGNKGGCY